MTSPAPEPKSTPLLHKSLSLGYFVTVTEKKEGGEEEEKEEKKKKLRKVAIILVIDKAKKI